MAETREVYLIFHKTNYPSPTSDVSGEVVTKESFHSGGNVETK